MNNISRKIIYIFCLGLILCISGCGKKEKKPLLLYCGAGIRPPVAEIVKIFEKERKIKIRTVFSGSNILLGQIKLSRKGDLYMPGDINYLKQAEKEGFIDYYKKACYFIPVILVQKDNPKNIKFLNDLIKPGVRLGLGNPESCAIGKKTEKIFKKNNIKKESIKKNLIFSSLTVNELGVAVSTGSIDAAIVWDANAAYYKDKCEIIEIDSVNNIISTVSVGLLNFSKNKKIGKNFIEMVISQRGEDVFVKYNYTTKIKGRE
jgi:molybdate transport system substrate-binding protein